MKKTRRMRELEAESGKDIRDLLIETYNRHGNIADAAAEFNVVISTFWMWLQLAGIEIRGTARSRDEVTSP